MDIAAEEFAQLHRHVGPRAHVLRFLLAPDDALEIRTTAKDAFEFFGVQRVELLDAQEGGIVRPALFLFCL